MNKRQRIPKRQSDMDHPEKLATGNKDETKNKIQIHNAICVGQHYTQANTNNVNKTWAPYKQLGVKTNRTSFLCVIRSGHHHT
jgi:hypothetical protein